MEETKVEEKKEEKKEEKLEEKSLVHRKSSTYIDEDADWGQFEDKPRHSSNNNKISADKASEAAKKPKGSVAQAPALNEKPKKSSNESEASDDFSDESSKKSKRVESEQQATEEETEEKEESIKREKFKGI